MENDSLSKSVQDLMPKINVPSAAFELPEINVPQSVLDSLSQIPDSPSRFDIPDIASYAPKSGWHQLIIIGNGFDKACTLKSGYEDFFKTRKDRLYPPAASIEKSEFDTWGEYISNDGITVWDLILEEDSGVLWNDIEQAIQRWIVFRTDTHPRSDSFSRTISLLNLEKISDIPNKQRQRSNWPPYEKRSERAFKEITIAQFILDNNGGKQSKWSEEKLTTYLLSELHKFEDEFSRYLLSELETNAEYVGKSKELLIDLLVEGLPAPNNMNILTSVLNFNYTSPALPSFNHKDVEIDMTNIHGKLGKEVVFGVDGKDCMNEELIVPFTKTYRLLGLHTTDGNRFFESVGSFAGNSPLDIIKVFGHSLASPDYSYFQALFDSVDLYGSSIKLIFYYRNHRENLSAETTIFKNVTRLMNAYGSTMDNKDHGKNLMHKLLLEGRLSVKELKHFEVSPKQSSEN